MQAVGLIYNLLVISLIIDSPCHVQKFTANVVAATPSPAENIFRLHLPCCTPAFFILKYRMNIWEMGQFLFKWGRLSLGVAAQCACEIQPFSPSLLLVVQHQRLYRGRVGCSAGLAGLGSLTEPEDQCGPSSPEWLCEAAEGSFRSCIVFFTL